MDNRTLTESGPQVNNRAIARLFATVADILEVKGENRFRVLSYRNGAEAIDSMGSELTGIYHDGGVPALIELPGIGKGIAAKIEELITTGRSLFVEELLESTPPGILDILHLAGMGPKKTGSLYRELGIDSIEALEAAAATGKLQTLPGFGEKTEQKILKAIESFKSFSGRNRISIARAVAAGLIEYLKEVSGVTSVEAAGSLRRWRENIGDVDLLAISTEPLAVMEAFTGHPSVATVVMKGSTRSTVVLESGGGGRSSGLQVDLRVLSPDDYGSALVHFTGSKAHNVALRERAKAKGLKVSEYGVFRVTAAGEVAAEGERIAGATEESVYSALGLPFIAPELREDRGEIEAALEGTLPTLVEQSDLRGDLHCHTVWSDGACPIEEMAEAAMALGYDYLAVTDHSRSLTVAHGLDSARLAEQIDKIDVYNEKLRESGKSFRLLKGSEVDILSDGTLDHPDVLLARLDIVVAAVHSGFGMERAKMTARVIAAIESGRVNIIAHPTGRLIGMREPFEIDMEAVLRAAKEHHVAMEVNSYPERLDLNDVHLRLAKELGVKVAISTDAHAADQFVNMEYGVHTARRGWIEPEDVINCLPLEELLRFLGKG
ncbi:MAG: DNA polymerase/3'-5' exonuclease PolX [Proteobacteria bacterium]|nr:DNA polymerase/3'-5' exonuclease PolX [Pseudomonadota bacterium]